VSHALIVLVGVPGLVLLRRRAAGADALGFLALLFLLRCVLDPVDQEYFALPLILSLLAWEVLSRRLCRGVPLLTFAAVLCLWVTFDVLEAHHQNIWLINLFYLGWNTALAVAAAMRFGSERATSAERHSERRIT
jgi:hypothetical protein